MGDLRPGPGDAELLTAVASGDRDALRMLYDRHQPWLTARLRHRCGDPAMVADSVQDTFLAAWKGAGRYDGSGEVGAWLWGIAIRQLAGRMRRRSWPLVRRPDSAPEQPSLLGSAEDQVLAGVAHGDLAGALARLSPELRAVVQATVLDGLTTREAGHLLGIPTGTVKTRMMRARIELRGALA